MSNLIDTTCINNDKPFEAYKINTLHDGRVEYVFLNRRRIDIGVRVKVRATYLKKPQAIIGEVTGNRIKGESKWEIFVMYKECRDA